MWKSRCFVVITGLLGWEVVSSSFKDFLKAEASLWSLHNHCLLWRSLEYLNLFVGNAWLLVAYLSSLVIQVAAFRLLRQQVQILIFVIHETTIPPLPIKVIILWINIIYYPSLLGHFSLFNTYCLLLNLINTKEFNLILLLFGHDLPVTEGPRLQSHLLDRSISLRVSWCAAAPSNREVLISFAKNWLGTLFGAESARALIISDWKTKLRGLIVQGPRNDSSIIGAELCILW